MAADDSTRAAWFEPARLYARGFHGQVQTCLQLFPHLRAHLERIVAEVAPRWALEVGAGDRPLIGGVAQRVFLDVAPALLRSLDGLRVLADLRACPLRPGRFDLVVAADVLTHIPPSERPDALAALARLAPRLLLLLNGAGAKGFSASAESIGDTVRWLEARRSRVQCDEFTMQLPSGLERRYAIVFAVRPETPVRTPEASAPNATLPELGEP